MRDFANMFFILALIIMSLATILRRPENYDARKLILRLILVALVINFTQVILVTIIHAVDSVTLIFANNTDLKNYWLLMKNIINPSGTVSGLLSSGGWYSDLVQSISGFILAGMMMTSFLAMAGLLIVRFVGLYVLIVLSPMALALTILPGTEGYWKMWYQNFVKYLIYAPVSAFLLYLGNMFFKVAGQGLFTAGNDNSAFTLIVIAIFYMMAFYIARKSGIQGAENITKWSKGASDMASKYIGRGTAYKRLGQGLGYVGGKIGGEGSRLSKLSALPGKGIEKYGRGIEAVRQQMDAAPKTIRKALEIGEKDYQKGVSKAFRQQLRMAGMIDFGDKDEMNKMDAEEVEEVFRGKIESGDLTASAIEELMPNLSKKGARGFAMMWKNHVEGNNVIGKWQDAAVREDYEDEIERALRKKFGLKENDEKLLNIIKDKTDKTKTGIFFDETDKDKARMKFYNPKIEKKNGAVVNRLPRIVVADAFDKPVLEDFLTGEELVDAEKKFQEHEDKFKTSLKFYDAVGNFSDMDDRIEKEAATGRIYRPQEARQVYEEISARNGTGPRTDISTTKLSPSGNRIYLSANVANDERVKMDLAENRSLSSEDVGELVKVIKEKGEMNDQQISKLMAMASSTEGISAFRGQFKAFSPYISESLAPERRVEVAKELRTEQRFQKEHELMEGYLRHIEKNNKDAYSGIVDQITKFDSVKFAELKNEMKKISRYKDINDDQAVKEILSNKKYRDQLSPETQNKVVSVAGNDTQIYKEYRQKRSKAIKSFDAKARLEKLRGAIIEAKKIEVPESITKIDEEVL
jgi:hypothetical protein